MSIIASLNVLLKGDASHFQKAVKTSEQVALQFKRTATSAFAAITAGLSVNSFKNMTLAVYEAVDSHKDLADRVGVSYNSLILLQHAAERNGSSAESMGDALAKMKKNLGELSYGSSGAVEAFTRIGLSYSQLKELSPEKQFISIIGKIRELKDPTQQAVALQDIFGKSAGDLAGVLQLTSTDLETYQDHLKKTGRILSDETVKGLQNAKDAVDDLSDAWEGLKTAIVVNATTGQDSPAGMLQDALVGARKEIEAGRPGWALTGAVYEAMGWNKEAEAANFKLTTPKTNYNPLDFAAIEQERVNWQAEQDRYAKSTVKNYFFGIGHELESSFKELAASAQMTAREIHRAEIAKSLAESAGEAASTWAGIATAFADQASAVYSEEYAKQQSAMAMLPGSYGVGTQEGYRFVAEREQRAQMAAQNPQLKVGQKANALLGSILEAVKGATPQVFKL